MCSSLALNVVSCTSSKKLRLVSVIVLPAITYDKSNPSDAGQTFPSLSGFLF